MTVRQLMDLYSELLHAVPKTRRAAVFGPAGRLEVWIKEAHHVLTQLDTVEEAKRLTSEEL